MGQVDSDDGEILDIGILAREHRPLLAQRSEQLLEILSMAANRHIPALLDTDIDEQENAPARPRVAQIIAGELDFDPLEELRASPVVGDLELDRNRRVKPCAAEPQIGPLGIGQFLFGRDAVAPPGAVAQPAADELAKFGLLVGRLQKGGDAFVAMLEIVL